MDTHVRVLGILHIVLGGLGVVVGLGFLLLFGGAASIVGMTAMPQDEKAFLAVPKLGVIGGAICVLALVVSLPAIIAGIGLLKFRPWARILTLVLSAINLLNVPIGTAIGVYGLWVLLNNETEPLFRQPLPPTAPAR